MRIPPSAISVYEFGTKRQVILPQRLAIKYDLHDGELLMPESIQNIVTQEFGSMSDEQITLLVGKWTLPATAYKAVANAFGVKDGQAISMAYWTEISIGNWMYECILPIFNPDAKKPTLEDQQKALLPCLVACEATGDHLYISRAVADLFRVPSDLDKINVSELDFKAIADAETEWFYAMLDFAMREAITAEVVQAMKEKL